MSVPHMSVFRTSRPARFTPTPPPSCATFMQTIARRSTRHWNASAKVGVLKRDIGSSWTWKRAHSRPVVHHDKRFWRCSPRGRHRRGRYGDDRGASSARIERRDFRAACPRQFSWRIYSRRRLRAVAGELGRRKCVHLYRSPDRARDFIPPSIVVAPGDKAARRYLKFSAITLENPNTRTAYFFAFWQFFGKHSAWTALRLFLTVPALQQRDIC